MRNIFIVVSIFVASSAAFLTPSAAVLRFKVPASRPIVAAARCASPLSMATAEDPYSVLGVSRTATPAQIKQAYRRLALRSHPDVNKEPDAEAKFARIAEAYATLSDEKARAKYDRRPGAWRSSSSSSSSSSSGGTRSDPWSGWDPSDPFGSATGRARDPAAQAAAEERRRRWKEQNPTPDELGDSFGALFNDVVSAVGKAVGGSGDWLSLLDELALTDGPELQTLLRSRDTAMLSEELESTQWVQKTLESRIKRLGDEASTAESDLADFRRDNAKVSGGAGAGSMSRSVERELEKDLRRRKERLADAKRLQGQAKTREQKIAARLNELRNGPPPNTRDRDGKPRKLGSVDDELESLKKTMGLGAGKGPPPPPPPAAAPTLDRKDIEKMKVSEIKAELKSLNVEPAGLFEKSDFVDALFAARARASAKR